MNVHLLAVDLTQLILLWCATYAGIERRIQLARDVFESIELVHTNECQGFLSAFFAPLLRLLQTTQPAFADSSEHRLRNTVLAAFSR